MFTEPTPAALIKEISLIHSENRRPQPALRAEPYKTLESALCMIEGGLPALRRLFATGT